MGVVKHLVRGAGFEPASLVISSIRLYSNSFLITQQPHEHGERLPIPPSPHLSPTLV